MNSQAIYSAHVNTDLDIETIMSVYNAATAGRLPMLNKHITGGGRLCYAINDDYVLKLPGNSRYGDNLTEAAAWELGESIHEYLAPCIAWDSDGAWLVMQRVSEVGQYSLDDEAEYQLSRHGINDQHSLNCGWLNDRVVSIDYACNDYRDCESSDPSNQFTCDNCGRVHSGGCHYACAACGCSIGDIAEYCTDCYNRVCKRCDTYHNSMDSDDTYCANCQELNSADKHAEWLAYGKRSFEALWAMPIVIIDNMPFMAMPLWRACDVKRGVIGLHEGVN